MTANTGATEPVEKSDRRAVLGCLMVLPFVFGGGCAGMELSRWVSPSSILAAPVGLFMLPLSFGLGMAAWWHLAAILVPIRFAVDLIRYRSFGRALESLDNLRRIPGRSVLLVVPVLVCALAGLIVSAVSDRSWVLVTVGYAVIGAAYGVGMYLCYGTMPANATTI